MSPIFESLQIIIFLIISNLVLIHSLYFIHTSLYLQPLDILYFDQFHYFLSYIQPAIYLTNHCGYIYINTILEIKWIFLLNKISFSSPPSSTMENIYNPLHILGNKNVYLDPQPHKPSSQLTLSIPTLIKITSFY
jgi:hypothetical protein